MTGQRIQTWLMLGALAAGVLVTAIMGLFAFMIGTARPIHTNPKDVPSATTLAPTRQWADAVAQGRQIVRADLVEQNLPGVSVAVGVGGHIVWAEGFGWADLERRVSVTPETRFRIGTASTVLSSAGVGLLLEQARLKLDETIQTHVPDFPEKQWPMTMRQVMGHLAGVRPDDGDEEPVTRGCDRTTDGVRRFAKSPLLFEPGTQYRFSSYDWILMSAAIEAAADERFMTFMRKHVFEPLGMDHTNADGEPARDRAVYYFPRFIENPNYGLQEPSEVDYSCFSGSSGFLSTASDLVRFGLAINSGTLLQPATVQLLQANQRLASGQETGYGLGWDLETVTLAGEHAVLIGHDGQLRGGMVASFMTFPQRGLVIAVLSNTSHADTFVLGMKVANAFVEKGRSLTK